MLKSVASSALLLEEQRENSNFSQGASETLAATTKRN